MRVVSFLFITGVAIMMAGSVIALPFFSEDFAQLTAGVDQVHKEIQQSRLVLFKEKAFPVFTNNAGDTSYAGSRHGKGRVFAVGHLHRITASKSSFITNIAKWVSGGKENPKVASWSSDKISAIPAAKVNVPTTELAKGDIDVYYVNAHRGNTDAEVADIMAFISGGGGVIVSGQAWAWGGNLKAGESFAEYPGNKILCQVGIMICGVDWDSKDITVKDMPSINANLYYALDSFKGNASNAIAQKTIARSSGFVFNFENQKKPEFQAVYQKGLDAMLSTKDIIGYSRLAHAIVPAIADSPYGDLIKPAHDVATFPYMVSEGANLVNHTITVPKDTTIEERKSYHYSLIGSGEYVSTGLYAPPSGKVKYTIPTNVVGKIGFQIGCHTDKLYGKNPLRRSPDISLHYPTFNTSGTLINPWGGLIYIQRTHGVELDEFDIKFENAIQAPYFVLGETTKAAWLAGIKDYPAPWAEIEIPNKIIFSIPSSTARKMVDIEEWAQHWDSLMTIAIWFSGYKAGMRIRPERFVFDIQISYGYMHAGYPIMGPISALTDNNNKVDARSTFVIASEFKKLGQWGPFHELGHNYFSWRYCIQPTRENNANWWSMALMNTTTEHQGLKAHPSFVHIPNVINDFALKGRHFKDWAGGLTLYTYMILGEKFGWSSYAETMKIYNENYVADGKITNTDVEKLNLWVVRYSNVVKTNLCPYFLWWDFPLTEETLTKCAELNDLDTDPLAEYKKRIADYAAKATWIATSTPSLYERYFPAKSAIDADSTYNLGKNFFHSKSTAPGAWLQIEFPVVENFNQILFVNRQPNSGRNFGLEFLVGNTPVTGGVQIIDGSKYQSCGKLPHKSYPEMTYTMSCPKMMSGKYLIARLTEPFDSRNGYMEIREISILNV